MRHWGVDLPYASPSEALGGGGGGAEGAAAAAGVAEAAGGAAVLRIGSLALRSSLSRSSLSSLEAGLSSASSIERRVPLMKMGREVVVAMSLAATVSLKKETNAMAPWG